jgi:hypothetical protein
MTILTRNAGNRGRGTWPGGEPESVRAAADATTSAAGSPDADADDALLASDRDWTDSVTSTDADDALDRTINPLSIGGLTGLCSDLLRDADDLRLPRPTAVMVSEQGQRIGLQFESAVTSEDWLWQWADNFETNVEVSRATRKGRRLVSVTFTYYGAAVEAYAHI